MYQDSKKNLVVFYLQPQNDESAVLFTRRGYEWGQYFDPDRSISKPALKLIDRWPWISIILTLWEMESIPAACDVMKHLQDSAVDRPSILGKGNDLVILILKISYCETFWEMNWNRIKPKRHFIWHDTNIYFSY